jgi:hypothetical protein
VVYCGIIAGELPNSVDRVFEQQGKSATEVSDEGYVSRHAIAAQRGDSWHTPNMSQGNTSVEWAMLETLDASHRAELEALPKTVRAEAIHRMTLWKRAESIHERHPRFGVEDLFHSLRHRERPVEERVAMARMRARLSSCAQKP